jgi:hypothetical protein
MYCCNSAVKWDKFEFLAGLICLLLYAIMEVITTFFFTISQGLYIDIAQFGFIMLTIVFFIIGVHPSWAPWLITGMGMKSPEKKPAMTESVISLLKKTSVRTLISGQFFSFVLHKKTKDPVYPSWSRTRKKKPFGNGHSS